MCYYSLCMNITFKESFANLIIRSLAFEWKLITADNATKNVVQQEGQIGLVIFCPLFLLTSLSRVLQILVHLSYVGIYARREKHLFRKIISPLNKSKREETYQLKFSLLTTISKHETTGITDIEINSILFNKLEASRSHVTILKQCQMKRQECIDHLPPSRDCSSVQWLHLLAVTVTVTWKSMCLVVVSDFRIHTALLSCYLIKSSVQHYATSLPL